MKFSTNVTRFLYTSLISLSLLTFTNVVYANNVAINVIENNLKSNIKVKGESEKSSSIIMLMKQLNVPGVSVAVIHNGKIDWAKGYGIANATRSVDTSTLFQAGSISKPVAALAALKLVEQGKLDLDVDVNQYLTNWKVEGDLLTKENPVTLRHLLTHTSGLSVHGFPGYATGSTIPSTTGVLSGKGNTDKVEVNQIPGSKWRYSGGGYTVMQKIVEDVSGTSFSEYTDNQILKPMGMIHSSYKHALPNRLKIHTSAAYNRSGEMHPAIYNDYPEKAAAGLWTTPSDLAIYVMHMQAIMSGKKDGILKKKTVEAMFTKHKGSWGLGPKVSEVNNELVFSHGGKNLGFTNEFKAFVNKGDGMIVMSNGDNGGLINKQIMSAISEYYGMGTHSPKIIDALPLTIDELKAFTGLYKMRTGENEFKLKLKVIDGQLKIKAQNEVQFSRLVPTKSMTFINVESGMNPFEFHRDDAGHVSGLLVSKRFKFSKINN
ncbi:serine hydrolase domain-containing protein [Paraglaciecola sp.]|uniref:serine hydrolase domain-containing protein n=1 Tax=Paraglaciecola sp. TaxID=1920173 RepID=UPI003EF61B13